MMDLMPSVSSDYFAALTPEETVEEYLAAGFCRMELGITHTNALLKRQGSPESVGREFAAWAANRGLRIGQGHLDLDMELTVEKDLDMLKRQLELYAGLGIRAAVLHATGAYEEPYEKQLALRGAAIAQLERHIHGTDIVICLENLFSKPMLRSADGILELIEAAGNGPQLGVCLDIGHLHRVRSHGLCADSSRDFIRKAGSRLKAIHVHDNLGDTDDHLLPFVAGGLNWPLFMDALRENGFEGLFNMEIHGVSNGMPMEVKRLNLRHAKALAEYLLSDNCTLK